MSDQNESRLPDGAAAGTSVPTVEQTDLETYLDRHGSLTYSNVGVSMLPLLKQGRDLFTVAKKGASRCRVGDVVLYRRSPGVYVLHRIVRVRPTDYVLLGDNSVRREYGVRDEDIVGVMTGFVRKGKSRRVTQRGYRLYAFWRRKSAPLRIMRKKLTGRIKRSVRRSMP